MPSGVDFMVEVEAMCDLWDVRTFRGNGAGHGLGEGSKGFTLAVLDWSEIAGVGRKSYQKFASNLQNNKLDENSSWAGSSSA